MLLVYHVQKSTNFQNLPRQCFWVKKCVFEKPGCVATFILVYLLLHTNWVYPWKCLGREQLKKTMFFRFKSPFENFSSHSCTEVLSGNGHQCSSAGPVRQWFCFTGSWSGPCLWKVGTLKSKYTRAYLTYCACNTRSCIWQHNVKLMWAKNVRFWPRLIIWVRGKMSSPWAKRKTDADPSKPILSLPNSIEKLCQRPF